MNQQPTPPSRLKPSPGTRYLQTWFFCVLLFVLVGPWFLGVGSCQAVSQGRNVPVAFLATLIGVWAVKSGHYGREVSEAPWSLWEGGKLGSDCVLSCSIQHTHRKGPKHHCSYLKGISVHRWLRQYKYVKNNKRHSPLKALSSGMSIDVCFSNCFIPLLLGEVQLF